MAITHQKFREIVFLLLYKQDFSRANDMENSTLIMEQLSVTRKNVLEAALRAKLVLDHLSEIDAKITEASTSYEFERIQIIERNILRLGVFELFYDLSLPPKVAIAEALRLTKKFGTPASTSFVNALLDYLYKKSLGEKIDIANLSQAGIDLKKSEDEAKTNAIDPSSTE